MKSILILLTSSTVILTLFCVSIINRFCVTSCGKADALKRSGFAFLFVLISIIMNTIYYLSCMYPNYIIVPDVMVIDFRNGMEIIAALIGSHIYRIFLKELYHRLYEPMKSQYPKPFSIKYTPLTMQLLVTIAVITCYTCNYVLADIQFIYFFYIFIDIMILFILFIFLYIWGKVLTFSKLIHFHYHLPEDHDDNNKVQKLLRLVQGVLIMAVILGIVDFVVIFIAFDFMFDFTPWSYDEVLMSNIVYSTFLIMVDIPLVIWAYQKSKCCVIAEDSVCAKCECHACCINVVTSGHYGIRNDADDVNSVPLEASGHGHHHRDHEGPNRRYTNTTTNTNNTLNTNTISNITNITVITAKSSSGGSRHHNHSLKNPAPRRKSFEPETINQSSQFSRMIDK